MAELIVRPLKNHLEKDVNNNAKKNNKPGMRDDYNRNLIQSILRRLSEE
jgi:hypothetical protein